MTTEQEHFLRAKPADTPGLSTEPLETRFPGALTDVQPQPRRKPTITRNVVTAEPPVSAGAIRGRALRSVTLRMNPSLVRALRRAASERSLDFVEPFTQQAIAESALARWLQDEGYRLD